jgi:hypothetical protein
MTSSAGCLRSSKFARCADLMGFADSLSTLLDCLSNAYRPPVHGKRSAEQRQGDDTEPSTSLLTSLPFETTHWQPYKDSALRSSTLPSQSLTAQNSKQAVSPVQAAIGR